MEQNESTPKILRWIIEAALWSILLVPISWLPTELSVNAAVILALAVAAVNTLAVSIATYFEWTNSRKLLLWVSLGVSFTWAIELTARSDPQFVDLLLAITTGPILGAWLLTDRWMKHRAPATKNEALNADRPASPPSSPELSEIAGNTLIVPPTGPLDEQYHSETDESAFEECEDEAPGVTQSITRSQTRNGETIEGWMRIEFAEGQREATVHLSFCPPLNGGPDIEVHDLDGTGLEIKVAASFPFGARLTVRRPIESHKTKLAGCSYRVGFAAYCAAATKAA